MHSDSQDRRPLIVLFIFALLLFGFSYWIQIFLTSQSLNAEKIAQLMRLFSMVLLFTAATLYFTGRRANETIRRNSFSLAIAGGSTMLLIGYRLLIGAGIGLHPLNATQTASGFLYYPEDNFSYAAWAAQASNGSLLFQNLYTLDPHGFLYFNPFFISLGFTARLLHVSVIPLMILVGITSSVVVVLSVFQICRSMDMPERASRWATLLTAFSSGMSVVAYYLGKWFGVAVPVGADLRYMDSILFSTFYALPYQSFAYAMQAIVVLLVFRCERENSTIRDFALLAVVQAFSVFIRPYEWVLLLGGYAVYVALTRPIKIKRLWILAVLAGATAPGVLYNWWLSHQIVWENFAQISLTQEKFRLYWLLGYGLAIPLALTGAVVAWKNPKLERTRWIGTIACLVIFLLIILNVQQVKMASCGHLFLCIASGIGIHTILSRLQEMKSSLNVLFRLALLPSLVLLFGSSAFLMLASFHAHTMDSELLAVANVIRPEAAVLCDHSDGNMLPAISAVRVYSGHWALTPGYSSDKKRALTGAGFEESVDANRDSFNRLLASEHFDFVLVQKERPAYDFIRSLVGAKLIQCYPRRCLFEIDDRHLN